MMIDKSLTCLILLYFSTSDRGRQRDEERELKRTLTQTDGRTDRQTEIVISRAPVGAKKSNEYNR